MEPKYEALVVGQPDRQMKILLETLSNDQLVIPYEPGVNPPVWQNRPRG